MPFSEVLVSSGVVVVVSLSQRQQLQLPLLLSLRLLLWPLLLLPAFPLVPEPCVP